MRARHLTTIVIALTLALCGGTAAAQSTAPAPGASLVGRWALLTLLRDGVELTVGRGAEAPPVIYTFNADRTFRIAVGDSVHETGTWSSDSTASPKVFDHTPDVNGAPGPHVPGIYEIRGDLLMITIQGPNAEDRHPVRFESVAANGSWFLLFRRVP